VPEEAGVMWLWKATRQRAKATCSDAAVNAWGILILGVVNSTTPFTITREDYGLEC